MPDFTKVEAGDMVVRMIAGTIPMQLLVTKVDDRLIWCHTDKQVFAATLTFGMTSDQLDDAWTFDRQTGCEEDLDLQWGVQFGRTGSMLVGFTKGGI